MDALVQKGKIRSAGCSNYTADDLRQALSASRNDGVVRFESLQPYLQPCGPLGVRPRVALIVPERADRGHPYSSLVIGFLTGKYRRGAALPASSRLERVKTIFLNSKGSALLNAVLSAAQDHNVPPGNRRPRVAPEQSGHHLTDHRRQYPRPACGEHPGGDIQARDEAVHRHCVRAAEIITDTRAGKNPVRRNADAPTMIALGKRFLKENVSTHCKPSTQEEYRHLVKLFIDPRIGRGTGCPTFRGAISRRSITICATRLIRPTARLGSCPRCSIWRNYAISATTARTRAGM